MQSTLAVLRQARSEVIPLVAGLAPWLPMERGTAEPDIVQEELLGAIADQGVDPDVISAPDFNKLSRHTLAGAVVGMQRNYLVEGKGYDARFDQEVLDYVSARGRDRFFMRALLGVQDVGARYVQSTYSAGRDADHSWYPLLRHRYKELGEEGLRITPLASPPSRRFPRIHISSPIPTEGRSIVEAMNSSALGATVGYMLRFVRHKIKDTVTRVEAAHDIAPQFLGGLASLHAYELSCLPPDPRGIQGEIVRNHKTGKYQLVQTREHRRRLYPHLPDQDLSNARLKCSAHAAVVGDDTNMMYFVHATINLGADHYGML